MIHFIIILISMYLLNNLVKSLGSLLKSPLKFIRLSKKPRTKNKEIKKQTYTDISLGRFKLSKTALQDMLRNKFISNFDPYLPRDKYKQAFLQGLNNYLLYKFPLADYEETGRKIKEIESKNLEYWLDFTKTLVK